MSKHITRADISRFNALGHQSIAARMSRHIEQLLISTEADRDKLQSELNERNAGMGPGNRSGLNTYMDLMKLLEQILPVKGSKPLQRLQFQVLRYAAVHDKGFYQALQDLYAFAWYLSTETKQSKPTIATEIQHDLFGVTDKHFVPRSYNYAAKLAAERINSEG